MNRITQCLHGKGTVSEVMKHKKTAPDNIPGKYLAFSGMQRPVVFWNLTNACNLGCSHCYSRSGPDASDRNELSTKEIFASIDDLAQIKIPLILLTGGEPLMRSDLFRIAEYADKKGIKTALSSNGTLITPDIAKKIRDSAITYVGISLDGASAKIHDRFRNSPGAFDRTIQAFSACKEAGVRTGIRFTVTRENIAELGPLISLALELGASRFCLYWLVPCGRGSDVYDRLQLTKDEVRDVLSLMYERAKSTPSSSMEFLTVDAPQDCIHLVESMKRDNSPDLNDAYDLLKSLKGGCSAGSRVANIDAEGNVYPCQFARMPDFYLGNVREKPFSQIWSDSKNPVLTEFRKKESLVGGKCGSCQFLELCGGGCRVRAYYKTGDFSAEDPFCYVDV
ncbi:radical SAM/SPASM domain-containing protein [Methanospirillum stamsii]|uniref:Radical SAM/SPASM domain-containing protein n=1 Tax=Methanospirillum stamsii TaxID=1277351 RepID=A0A2V2NBJ3_9EURY|nr:radical SAM protein [Methanospirillum stamsii]PWR75965.1 radical SAM/SPASM domain-containing protein [Methanospirillum stamsii]